MKDCAVRITSIANEGAASMRTAIFLLVATLALSGCISTSSSEKAIEIAIVRVAKPIEKGPLFTERVAVTTIDDKEAFTFPQAGVDGRVVPIGRRTVEVIWTSTTNGVQTSSRAMAKFTFVAKAGKTYCINAKKLDAGATLELWIADNTDHLVDAPVTAKIYYSL